MTVTVTEEEEKQNAIAAAKFIRRSTIRNLLQPYLGKTRRGKARGQTHVLVPISLVEIIDEELRIIADDMKKADR